MQSGLIVFVLMFVVACWIFVIGHQLGLNAFNPNRYPVLDGGSLAIAYTVAALSLCAVAALFVAVVVKK